MKTTEPLKSLGNEDLQIAAKTAVQDGVEESPYASRVSSLRAEHMKITIVPVT
jgi:hypothetical protein